MNDETTTKFKQSLRGVLIQRDDPDYDDARQLYNGMIDKRPLMIARCADAADVIAAVNFGRDRPADQSVASPARQPGFCTRAILSRFACRTDQFPLISAILSRPAL